MLTDYLLQCQQSALHYRSSTFHSYWSQHL